MKNRRKGFVIPLIITIIAIIAIGAGTYLYINKKTVNSLPIVCTMEAKLCPDGSYVGRTGPNCEFPPCPAINNKQTECNTNSDCQNGASCVVKGPLIANQPIHKVCVPVGQAVPL